MPDQGTNNDLRRCRWLGLAGSMAVAVGGLASGALPNGEPPLLDHARFGLFLAYFGMVLLITAWLMLGRSVRGVEPRVLLVTLTWWAAPLVLGPPLFSRDVYSYLAQGAMVDAGLDAYRVGPAVLGGPLAAQVPEVWQHTPAPYGPVFLALAGAALRFTGTQIGVGVLAMRLLALLGIVAVALMLPRLARRCGVDPAGALWLAALNPLLLFHLLSGAHNDAVMLALLVGGLLAASYGRPLWGGVLVTMAALVKVPSALGLLGVAMLWSQRLSGPARVARALAATAAVAVVTTAVVTAFAGTGYGWIGALGTPVSADNWAPTNALGHVTGAILSYLHSSLAPSAVPVWHWLGLAAAAGAVAVMAVLVHLRRLNAVHAVGLGLAVVVALGPAIRPWYALWGLVLIAAAAPDGRARRWAAAISGVLALCVLPDGFAPGRGELALAVSGGLLALACAALLARPEGRKPLW